MRWRQAVLLVAAMTLVLAALLVPLARLVQTSARDRAVSAATDKARNLEFLVATVGVADLGAAVQQANAETPRFPATVYLGDQTIGAPAQRTEAVRLAATGASFVAVGTGGWEVVGAVTTASAGTVVVRVFVADAELNRGVGRAWLILSLLGLGVLVVAVVVSDRLTRGLIRPIRELAAVSTQLAAGRLEARSRGQGPPEVRAVALALNHLAERILDLLQAERESVADISHRLRTPLTALRLEVEATPHAEVIAGHVRALEAAVTSVIEQARTGPVGEAACDAVVVVGDRCAFWAALADDQRRTTTVQLPPHPVPVGLAAPELSAAVDAILGNVFAHTAEGVAYRVAVTTRPRGGARLVVEDDGDGFADADAARRGASGAGSTGLGLDIVRRAARASGGDLSLGRSSTGGARVVVELGPPPA